MKIDVYRREGIDEDLIALMKEYNTPAEKQEILLFQQIRILKKIEAAIIGQPLAPQSEIKPA